MLCAISSKPFKSPNEDFNNKYKDPKVEKQLDVVKNNILRSNNNYGPQTITLIKEHHEIKGFILDSNTQKEK